MNPRYMAIRDISLRKPIETSSKGRANMEQFGRLTFSRPIMQKMLSEEVCANVLQAMQGQGKINTAYADDVASAMKDWAIEMGATHFTHWFQPMTGLPAEKHDAFLDWKTADTLIEKFSGKQLMRGEPDASSFPSGGLRCTSEARGYTAWDPSSSPYLWKSNNGLILCIPSFFYSWTGQILDMKIPLLRSDAKINQSCMRLMRLLGVDANSVYSTLGCEQEYFLVDRGLSLLRPDLLLAGRTVFGSAPSKGQELEDHYFGTVKERVLSYMCDIEAAAFELGIPLKTRHCEVAPGQYEVAPVFEKASLAVDHNILLMELMRQIATRHGLSCLFHEKPFADINGSGKHNNWSLSTDTGINLLDPTSQPENSLLFLMVLTAILNGVHRHAALLRTSIASAGNDHRLGGHEAPPVIISVYLGEELENMLDHLENDKAYRSELERKLDLQLPILPELSKDCSDRNRTSPFAFTGNKFEFRAVGASANCSFPITVLNVIVAESLNQMIDEVEEHLGTKPGSASPKLLREAAMPVIRKYLQVSRPIRFTGNNYSSEWTKEAKKRGLPIIEKSFHSFAILEEAKTKKIFEGVLSKEELKSRYEISCELYIKIINIEAKLMVDIFRTQILPAAMEYQETVAGSIKALRDAKQTVPPVQVAALKRLSFVIAEAIEKVEILEKDREKASHLHSESKGKVFCERIAPKSREARKAVDELETLVDDRLWPLPKYRELLTIL